MSKSLLDELSEVKGIEGSYIDAWGQSQQISESTKSNLLSAMGYNVADDQKLNEQVNKEYTEQWLKPLNPVLVVRENTVIQIPVRLPIELATEDFYLSIQDESNGIREQAFCPVEGTLINVIHFEDGDEFQEYLIDLDEVLEAGYHSCSLKDSEGNEISSMKLIVAPKLCYQSDDLIHGNKSWGINAQLYCLRSQDNWGVGDFADLTQLVEKLAACGADFVGLNPLHALYPNHPDACSPYGPSSRRWLNFVYLAVPELEGFEQEAVQSKFHSESFQTELQRLRDNEKVDYPGVMQLKRSVLELIFSWYDETYLNQDTQQAREFNEFVKYGGDSLQNLATFDAIQEYLAEQGLPSWGWPVFPEEFQHPELESVVEFREKYSRRVRFYLYLQWQASQQLLAAQRKALSCGMGIGLYLDLAVGENEGSAEVWGNPSLYARDASIGAPPDVLGPLGQKWGLPPVNPERLYQQAYQPFINLISSNMKACGALRLDHVMALLRLWWVPSEAEPKDGGYVYYPMEDMLGILALESQRHKTAIIGEDLGTVPEEVRTTLAENGILSYRVFLFEQADDGGFFSPAHYPHQSLAALTTHDMPTLRGYWHCEDLILGKTLGFYQDGESLTSLYDKRLHDKQQILDSLHGHGQLPAGESEKASHTGMHQRLNHVLQVHMAKGSSALLSLQLEDWLDMADPVNVPGTSVEYPNWQRKLSRTLESIFSDQSLLDLAQQITKAREVSY